MASMLTDWEKQLDFYPEEYRNAYKRFKRANEILYREAEPQVGLTPKEVVWTKNKAKLYRYVRTQEQTHAVPLLLVYALINKPYVMDLAPGSSLIEYLVNRGFDVYLLDWGTFGPEDSQLKFDDLVMDYIAKAVKKVLRISGADDISILGYCMGGTMTSMYAALHPHMPIRNLVFMTSPFDFSDTGLYAPLVDERYFNLDKAIEVLGNIPPEMIDFGNKMLKPITNFAGPYVSLFDRSDNQRFVDSWKLVQKWVADGIPMPGETYRQWIGELYQKNKLVKGEFMIRGQKVKLENIKANVLNLSAQRDHIAKPCQVEALLDHISSQDKQYVSIPTGHMSIVYGGTAVKQTYPTIGDWLEARSQ